MRVIVIGAGEVGRHLGITLAGDGHDVTVVDSDPQRTASLADQIDAFVVTGNGASPKLLHELEAGRADLLLAVTQQDEVNVIAALAGHELGAKRTVARVRDPDYFEHDYSFSRDVLGIDFVIDPDRATAHDLLAAIETPAAVDVKLMADGTLAVAESILTERSPLIGTPLASRDLTVPHAIIGVVRDGQASVATGEELLEPGDRVVVAAPQASMREAVARLAGRARNVRDVAIFGGGKIGFQLARLLEPLGYDVTVIEPDPERARFVAEHLPVTVLNEEGVGKQAMLASRIDSADAFVASAGDDRKTLLAAMHAKQIGADLTLAVISREEFVPLVSALGIDAAFSPRVITAEAILEYVRGGNVRALHLTLEGFEVSELEAETGSRIVGQQTNGDTLPSGCNIGPLLREGSIVMPDQAGRILAGDRVLVFGVLGASTRAGELFRG